jgi:hypothetical protein
MAALDACIRTRLAGVDLASPIVAAAGTCGYMDELADAFDLRWLGADRKSVV